MYAKRYRYGRSYAIKVKRDVGRKKILHLSQWSFLVFTYLYKSIVDIANFNRAFTVLMS